MKILPVDSIIIPENRIRRSFEERAIKELANSIAFKGLWHPIVLRNDGITLVAGERRLRAISSLDSFYLFDGCLVPKGHIPTTTLLECDILSLKEIELEENVCRKDLTWQERASASAELHALRLAQSAGTQTLKATASEITGEDAEGSQITNLSDSIIVSKHLDDPEVAGAPSLKEAKKIISAKLEVKFREHLMSQIGAGIIAKGHSLHHGSCLDIIKTLPSKYFDCVVTDPPYCIGADTFGTQATTIHKYSDGEEEWATLMKVISELQRVLKPQSHVYMFCDIRRFDDLKEKFSSCGFDVWPFPLIWHKRNGMLPSPLLGPRRVYEIILYANHGKRPVIATYNDLMDYPSPENKLHAAQKPVDLYIDLLRRTCTPGNKILDLYAGTFPILPAANKLSLQATAIEISRDFYNIGLGRINE